MTEGRLAARIRSHRLHPALSVGLPLLAGLLVWGWLAWTDRTPSSPEALATRVAAIEGWFTAGVRDAAGTAERARDDFDFAASGPEGARGFASRIEGLGLLDRDLAFLTWNGMPPEPGEGEPPVADASFVVRRDGIHTRLVIRTAADDHGRSSIAGLILDSRHDALAFDRLIPDALAAGLAFDVAFGPAAAEVAEGAVARLDAPDGTPLGTMSLAPLPSAIGRLRHLRLAGSVAALAGLIALGFGFDWRRISSRPIGLLATLATIAACRALLLVWRLPHPWFPRDWAGAGFYGSPEAAGLLGSPLDLLATGLALYLAGLAVRRAATEWTLARRLAAGAVAAAGAIGLTAAAVGIASSIAHDSSAPLLEAQGFWNSDPRPGMAIGLALVLIGAAECSIAAIGAAVPRRAPGRPRPGRAPVIAAFLLLALAAAGLIQGIQERLDLERLESEYLPQVLEQSARRSVALTAAVRRVQEEVREAPGRFLDDDPDAGDRAYRFWSGSELFQAGYESSLTLYDADGRAVDHFGFDVPPLPEEPVADPASPDLVWTAEDDEPLASTVRKRLQHAEMALVAPDGANLGWVIGHVIDEPDNLPFLPGPRAFLDALGPGPDAPRLFGGPHYVLYDAQGTVVLSTLREPPSESTVLRTERGGEGAVRVIRPEQGYRGVAIRDDGRLHLLLTETRGPLERVAAGVRLALIGLAWIALHGLTVVLREPGSANPLRAISRSFRRRLLVSVLLASALPLVLLALFLRGFIQAGGEAALDDAATQLAAAAQRVLTDYAELEAAPDADSTPVLDDPIVSWLGDVIGQEIHVYERGRLRASSKRELFTSGLLPERLDGRVYRGMVREGLPYLVVEQSLGPRTIPVAYAPVRDPDVSRELVVAVPMVGQRSRILAETNRVVEMLLLVTALLVGLLWVVAVLLARTVASPLRELVSATGRIAAGDYETRLEPRTRDEVAELVRGFNGMAAALGAQRADLERRRDYMERLLQHATTGVISLDPAGRVVTLNPAARAVIGAFGGRVPPGSSLAGALAERDALAPLARAVADPPAAPGEPFDVDLDLERQPRRVRLVQVDLPDPAGGSVGRLLLLDDVTELMRSNQLAAWAEMARAIAHEIKNPLTPIQLSTEHLRRLLRDRGVLPSEVIDACLDTVIKQVRNLYDIAGEFSTYARLPALHLEPSDPVQFLREAAAPYRSAPPPGIEIAERYAPAGTVLLDTRVLGRAVVNLIENAIQAMPDGGTLTLEVAEEGEASAPLVRLSVADTGIGLDDEVRRRLFEPYFSTKSSGTGLGLAIVQRTVQAHHGRIDVQERTGGGTVFHVRLPRHRPVAVVRPA